MSTYFYSFKLGDPTKTYSSVSVAGTFNDWSTTHDELKYELNNGYWTLGVNLKKPKFAYKYVVNGTDWILDKDAPSKKDSNGNENNYGIAKETVLESIKNKDTAEFKTKDAERSIVDISTTEVSDTLKDDASKSADDASKSTDDASKSTDVTPASSLETADEHKDYKSTNEQEEVESSTELVKADHSESMPLFYRILASIKWFINYYILSLFHH